jgi:hypothetical protein
MKNLKKTQILVLGSTHLHGLGDKFRPELLDNLIQTLKRFKPDLICVENLSGEVIERMQRGGDEKTATQFASAHIRSAKKAQKLVGLSRVEVEQRSRQLLSQTLTLPKRLEPNKKGEGYKPSPQTYNLTLFTQSRVFLLQDVLVPSSHQQPVPADVSLRCVHQPRAFHECFPTPCPQE